MRVFFALAIVLSAPGIAQAEQFKIGPYGGEFGRAVALDGDTLAVGAPSDAPDSVNATGAVFVYRDTGGSWALEQLIWPTGLSAGDRFGDGLALQGDTLIVGAPGDPTLGLDAGALYVFTRVGSVWSLQQKLLALNGTVGDRIGDDVALDGATIVAAGRGPRVFGFDGGLWIEQAELAIGPGDLLAADVDISGDWIITGPGGHLFQREDTAWPHRQSLGGESVAIDGLRSLIGNPAGTRGSARFFRLDGQSWISDSREFHGLYPDLDGDGDIGGPGGDPQGSWDSGDGVVTPASCSDCGILLASYNCCGEFCPGDVDDDLCVGLSDVGWMWGNLWCFPQPALFGACVALDQDRALVGSPGQIWSECFQPGAAHVLKREAGQWVRFAHLAEIPAIDGAGVGASVAIDAGRAAIGAVPIDGFGAVLVDTEPRPDWTAPPASYGQVMDNGGFVHSGMKVDSVDLRLALGGIDDWTSTQMTVTLLQPGRTLNPRTQSLAPAAWFEGDPPLQGVNAWRNQRSSPSNWPNDYEDDSTMGWLSGATINDTTFANVAWFDSNGDWGVDFAFFRLAIRKTDPNAPGLTLDFTGVPVARITGYHTLRETGGLLRPFELTIYAERCLGDLDGDNDIDQSDMGILLADYGCSDGPGNCPGDVDNDGDTDQSDLGFLLAKWNQGCD